MKLISWNVNGIRAVHKKNLFAPFLEEFNPDIICLQETKAEQHQSPIRGLSPLAPTLLARHEQSTVRGADSLVGVKLEKYKEFWNSAVKKGYSGTAIFSKIEPENVVLNFPTDISKKYSLEDKFGNPNTEGRIIVAEFKKYFVVTVYTPNAKDDLSRLDLRHKLWDVAFLEYMKKLEKKKPVIFCGDLNVAHTSDDLARPKENVGNKGFTFEEREGIQKIIDAGFVDTFRIFTKGNGFYTWWSHFANARARNVGWRIDYFFVSKILAKKVKKAEILSKIMGSDHCPILLDIDIK